MSVLMLSLAVAGVMAAAPPRFPFDDFASHGYDAVLGSPFAASDPGWRPSRVSVCLCVGACVSVWVCEKPRQSRRAETCSAQQHPRKTHLWPLATIHSRVIFINSIPAASLKAHPRVPGERV